VPGGPRGSAGLVLYRQPALYGYLKRLLRTGAGYQASDVVAAAFGLLLLPVYTRALTRSQYGTAELLLTAILTVSIVVRLGGIEALVRYYYLHDDPAERDRVVRTATGWIFVVTTAVALLIGAFAEPLSKLVLGFHDATLMWLTALGIWAYTNLEAAYAVLRVDERVRPYLIASMTNVALTIGLTVLLVVPLDQGARGMLLGNYGASAVVLVGLWFLLRGRLGVPSVRVHMPPMLRFGLPTVPAEVSVFLLNVIDRFYIYRTTGPGGPGAAGLYSLAVKFAAVIIMVVRAFQYAWPPLAYSVKDDREAARLYATVATYYVLFTGLIVAGMTLLGRWVLRVFAAPAFFGAHEALPWVTLGWALYGLFLILTVMAGRAKVTTRNFPAAALGLGVNVLGLVLLVDPLGIAGAGIALCAAYVAMVALMYWFARRLFPVAFEWGRLAHLVLVIGGITVAGELLLPTAGAGGFVGRALALLAIPAVLAATGFLRAGETRRLRALVSRAGAARAA
jgi:O-antigen/teichoic acid export membrane protein